MKYPESEVKKSREYLLKVLKPGDTVIAVVRNVSRSGLTRHIDFYVVNERKDLNYLTYSISRVLGMPMAPLGRGLKVRGVGMDMADHVARQLCYALWGDDGEKHELNSRVL